MYGTLKYGTNTMRFIALFAILFSLLVAACHSSEHKKGDGQQEIFTVTERSTQKNLYFSGYIKPFSVIDVTCPVAGTVAKKYFVYGQAVQKNDPLLEINSSKYAADYQQALVQYLKAKDEYFNEKSKFIGTEDLWKNKLISKNEFQSEESKLAGSFLSYLQARSNLQDLLGRNIDEQLSIKDTEAVRKTLSQLSTVMKITAPANGIILYPSKRSEGGDEDSNIEIGGEIKAGQTLLTIGDLSSISVDISVGEIDIDKIKKGQAVTISGISLPKALKGQVYAVGAQAKISGSSGGLPSFSIKIIAPNPSNTKNKPIRVGMSAKVTIEIPSPPRILIPIKAVYEKNGVMLVKVFNPKTKTIKETVIKAGETTLNEVEIKSGLTKGDQIVIHH